ncbi:MAG TPA: hypothetical protein VLV89_10105 [Candidatus Acidoferrum sp.]|nr:hypothetical protein [Candidatus Acidoferrum sp.]
MFSEKRIMPTEREEKIARMETLKGYAEKAYDDMYEKAHSPSDATGYYSTAKESLYDAIRIAKELGLTEEATKLEARLAHIKAVFRSQFC